MKIGWDLDGCLANQDVIQICSIKGNKELEEIYYGQILPNCHLENFSSNGDETVIITARPESLREITQAWVDKWFPTCKLYITPVPQWATIDGWNIWYNAVAEAKAQKINELHLDVYFEDMPKIVKILRRLCPNTKIIQFGGRI